MYDPKTYSFDVEKMTEFFKQNDFTKQFAGMKMPGFDGEAMMAAQKKNMDALVEANKAAAAGYQDLFKKQVAIFEETMAEAQKHMKSFDATKLDALTVRWVGGATETITGVTPRGRYRIVEGTGVALPE